MHDVRGKGWKRRREEIRREEARKGEEERARMQAIASAKVSHEKLIAAVKRADYLERAMREEERALLEQDAKKQQVIEREAYENKVRQLKEIAMARHEADMEIKSKLPALQVDRDTFLKAVKERRLASLDAARIAMEGKLAVAKEARRQEMKSREGGGGRDGQEGGRATKAQCTLQTTTSSCPNIT